MNIIPPPLEPRLQGRYQTLVRAHMKAANVLTAGPAIPPNQASQHAATQASWRFLNNDKVTLTSLIEPLRELARSSLAQSASPFALVVHDWSKLDFKSHGSKTDTLKITHAHDVGYDLTSCLLVDAATGQPLAPVQMHLKTAEGVYSTAAKPPKKKTHHLEQLLPAMKEIGSWDLPRRPVHIVDREADSLGHYRQWVKADHLFLVRADDRRVLWEGESVLLVEIVKSLEDQRKFSKAREVLYHGKSAVQFVAETAIVLHMPHKTRSQGKQREIAGAPIAMRLIVSQVRDEEGKLLAQWMLLSNVPTKEVTTAELALWYYWRWRIESFFKLLKSDGLQLEQWKQQNGLAIARRLLIGAMACAVVWCLQHEDSPAAKPFRQMLIRLSGRSMGYGVESTVPALLAGYFIYLTMVDFLSTSQTSLEELIQLGRDAGVPFFGPGKDV